MLGTPERRSALIANELPRLNVDTVGLSEVRFQEEGRPQVQNVIPINALYTANSSFFLNPS